MKREYGIDLLKMVAMVMVVAYHILNAGVESKLLENGEGQIVQFGIQCYHCFCYCAVDVFVMATGYIMCRLGFKYVRIFRLWRQVAGYSLAFCAVGCFMGLGLGWRDWGTALLPITTNQYWFFTQYFALFFTIPFLNKMLDGLKQRELVALIGTGIGLLSILPLIAGRDLFVTEWGYCYVWFMFLYCIGAVLHKLDVVKRINVSWAVAGLVAGVVASALGAIGSVELPKIIGGGGRVGDLAYSYTSPSLILEALSLFVLFGKMRVEHARWQKLITLLATGTFVVYIVHMNGVFRRLVEWDAVFTPLAGHGVIVALIGTLGCALGLFLAIIAIDSLRRLLYDKVASRW